MKKIYLIWFLMMISVLIAVRGESANVNTFTELKVNDLECNKQGNTLNISWNNENDFFVVQASMAYEGELYTIYEAMSYGFEFDAYWADKSNTNCKWGGTVSTLGVPQVILDNGYNPVFQLISSSDNLEYHREGKTVVFNNEVVLDWWDYENTDNKFEIYNKTLVYLSDDGHKFHDDIEYDPTITVTASPVGVFNNTFLNTSFVGCHDIYSGDVYPCNTLGKEGCIAAGDCYWLGTPFIQLNLSLGNGTYTTPVYHISNYTSQITNTGMNVSVPAGTNITQQVRTKNFPESFFDRLLVFMDFDGGECINIISGVSGTIKGELTNTGAYEEQGYYEDGIDRNSEGCSINDDKLRETQNFTVIVYATNNNTRNEFDIIDRGYWAGWDLMAQNGGYFKFRLRLNGSVTSEISSPTQYTGPLAITMRYNGTKQCLMFNNTGSCKDAVGNVAAWSNYWTIGAGYNNNFPFNGTIDNVFVWNRTLSDAEVVNYTQNLINYNYTDWSSESSSTDLDYPDNSVNGTFLQKKYNFYTTNSSVTPVLYGHNHTIANLTVGGTPPAEDTCPCTGTKDCSIDCSENIIITDECNVNGYDLFLYNTGTIIFEENILNVKDFYFTNDCDWYIMQGKYITFS